MGTIPSGISPSSRRSSPVGKWVGRQGYFNPHTVAVRHTETSQIRSTVVIYYHEIPVLLSNDAGFGVSKYQFFFENR